MPVYFQRGVKPANPQNQTNQCTNCTPVLVNFSINNLVFDTERDARVAWNAFAGALLGFLVPQLWTLLWNRFQCTNQQCQRKAPCGNAPTWLQVGTQQFQAAPGAPIQWQVFMELAREIQCIQGAGGGEDVTPEIPSLAPPGQQGPTPPSGGEPRPPGIDASVAPGATLVTSSVPDLAQGAGSLRISADVVISAPCGPESSAAHGH